MRKRKIDILFYLFCILQFTFLISCSPKAMDDFFGIQMDPKYADSFEIVSYTPKTGVQYKSNTFMNPLVYAYAESDIKEIRIKIVNLDSSPLKINYNLDKFYLCTEKEKYELIKGEKENYAKILVVKTNESIEFNLELPSDLLDIISLINPQSQSTNFPTDFWKVQSSLNIVKEKIKYIQVNIEGDLIIILKPIQKN